MSLFIIYLFCSLGISYAWSDTQISQPLRNLIARVPYVRKPLLCHECVSFWISLSLSFFINPLQDYTSGGVSHLLSGFCGFFINMVFVRKHFIPYRDS
jgi:hypothetical protein